MEKSKGLKGILEKNGPLATVIFASLATFLTYSCMYAYRKAFAAYGYKDAPGFDFFGSELTFKTVIVIAQVIGYTLSKFLGIKIISEASSAHRQRMILIIISLAWVSLAGFALVPFKVKPLFLFLNGLPLGMVWGLVFSFIEGRKFTELMGAALCTSFALASGFAKDIGSAVIDNLHVSPYWMPFTVGAIYFVPLLIAVWMLGQIPMPTEEDKSQRMERQPMDKVQRRKVFAQFAPGLILLILTYVLLSAFRDYRDNFQKEIFTSLGYGEKPGIFTQSESVVTFTVLAVLASFVFIKNNKLAFNINKAIIIVGIATAGLSTFLFQQGTISGMTWMICTGFSTYIAYIPFNAFLFERFIAVFRLTANAGFFIYLADSFGYLGSVAALLYKDVFNAGIDPLQFFINANYVLAFAGVGCMLFAFGYFWKKERQFKRHCEERSDEAISSYDL